MAASFRHSGKLGDIVYSLATAKASGGGQFFIYAENGHASTNNAMALLPLLRLQPYISCADIWSDQEFDCDLDAFRSFDVMRSKWEPQFFAGISKSSWEPSSAGSVVR